MCELGDTISEQVQRTCPQLILPLAGSSEHQTHSRSFPGYWMIMMRVVFSDEVTFSYYVIILVFSCLQLFQNILLDPAKVVLLVLVQTDQSGFDADHLQIAAS